MRARASRNFSGFLLAHGEVHFDRIQRRDGGQSAAGRTDEGTHLKLCDTGDPVDGRGQSRESKIDARCFDGGCGGFDSGDRRRDLRLVGFDLRFGRL